MKIVFHPNAFAEFEDACAFFERRQAGLGERLRVEVNQCLENIQERPHTFPVAYRQLRRAPVKVFPYRVYYLLDGDVIRIWAVFDERRNPSVWRTRV